MRIVSCLAAALSVIAALTTSAFATPLSAPPAPAAASDRIYVAGGNACKQRCKSQYTCVGPHSTLKDQCLKDRRACFAACK